MNFPANQQERLLKRAVELQNNLEALRLSMIESNAVIKQLLTKQYDQMVTYENLIKTFKKIINED